MGAMSQLEIGVTRHSRLRGNDGTQKSTTDSIQRAVQSHGSALIEHGSTQTFPAQTIHGIIRVHPCESVAG